jgi:hypothetical protein
MSSYKKYFFRALEQNYPQNYHQLIAKTEENAVPISKDTAFAAKSGNPIDKRLEFCGYFLALVKTLDQRGESFDEIRKICLEIVIEYVRPKNKIHALAKKIPARVVDTWFANWIFRRFARKVSKNKSTDGFIARIITDKQETFGLGYGVDIIECGICKLFNKHGLGKYASILCEVDKLTSNMAGLILIRTGTIANGAEKCDFRYKRISKT